MKKIKFFLTEEKSLSKIFFGLILSAAFVMVFAPAIGTAARTMTLSLFQRIYPPVGCGYGWGYGYGTGYGFGYGCFYEEPVDGVYQVTPDNLAAMGNMGLILPDGGDPTNTNRITFIANTQLNLPGGAGSVQIPAGTTFTTSTGQDFTQLASQLLSSLSIEGQTILGSFEFGFALLGITVEPAITININVPTQYNGQLVNIFAQHPPATSYSSFGQCTIASGVCSFTTSQLSGFAASATTGGSGGTGGGTGGYTRPDDEEDVSGELEVFGYGMNDEEIILGSLIKVSGFPAVYYVDQYGRRHVFVHQKVYTSWYGSDFSNVITVSLDTAAKFALGKPVTYRPGTMIKIISDPKVYLATGNGRLKHIANESVAKGLFGSDWNKKIDDVDPAFFYTYSFEDGSIESTDEVGLDSLGSQNITINTETTNKSV